MICLHPHVSQIMRFSYPAILKCSNSQIEHFSNSTFLKSSISQMEHFSNGAILKSNISQMEHFSNEAILKSNISQMEHFSNGAILKWSNSQIEHFSNGAIWGRHHQLDDSLVGQLTIVNHIIKVIKRTHQRQLAHRMPYFSVLGILKYGIGWRPQNAPFENCSI